MNRKKKKAMLEAGFGKVPKVRYYDGDMDYIRAYCAYRQDTEKHSFFIDEITWNDLDMDSLFRRINPGLSASGEQYLYYMLHSPVTDGAGYDRRQRWIALMEENPDLRLKLQVLLSGLGRTRRADLCQAFHPDQHGRGWLLVYLFHGLLFVAMLAAAIAARNLPLLILTLFLAVWNSMLHETRKNRCQWEFDTVNYIVNMVFVLHKIRRWKDPALDALLGEAYGHLDRLQSVLRTGGVSMVKDNGFGDLVASVLELDLIAYEFLKNKLGQCHGDVFAVHEALGRIDAAIAVASYRKSLGTYAVPEIDFAADRPYLQIHAMTHPLLPNAVPNDLQTDRPILITGSNASGKSTYLKTAAISALLAQSVCTVTAESYRASVFRIYSSMALSDDLLAGESYYIAETRSLKRILDALPARPPVLCTIDEVLRGTNTVERIAASSTILEEIAGQNCICLAATHDIELCDLLERQYDLYHFEEQVGLTEMLFDYRIRPGKAVSRNAINLLRLMGFAETIIDGAHTRANRYTETGTWR